MERLRLGRCQLGSWAQLATSGLREAGSFVTQKCGRWDAIDLLLHSSNSRLVLLDCTTHSVVYFCFLLISTSTTEIMVFTRFVEVGRVVLINYGPETGKLATIIDIVDQNKCLIDGPAEITGVSRQVISYKRIALTDLTVKIQANARQATLKKAWAEADTLAKWEATSWAKKLAAKKKRAALNDFARFKVMVARKQKSEIIAKKVAELEA